MLRSIAIIIYLCLALTAKAQKFLDPGFGDGGIVITQLNPNNNNIAFNSIITTSDGKILTAGNGAYSFALIKYNSSGLVDSSFGNNGRIIHSITNSVALGGSAQAIVEQADGKIVVAGYADMGSMGNDDIAVVRLNADGTLDNSFGNAGEAIFEIYYRDKCWGIALQNDGKIVLCGDTKYGGESLIMRLNSDGSLDTTFNKTGIFTTHYGNYSESLEAILVRPDGKILAGGHTQINSDLGFLLLQLLPNGTLDSNFGTNGAVITSGLGFGNDIALQHDGKIVMVGREIFSDGYIVRYLPDGRIDSGFATNGIINIKHPLGNLGLETAAIDANGKIYAAGFVYDGPSSNSDEDMFIIRLDSTGKKDPFFGGSNGIVTSVSPNTERTYSMCLQPNGKILTAGSVDIGQNIVNGVVMRYLPFPVNVQEVQAKNNTLSIYPNPATERIFIKSNNSNDLPANVTYQITDISGRKLQAAKLKHGIDVSNLEKGIYIFTIQHKEYSLSTYFLKK